MKFDYCIIEKRVLNTTVKEKVYLPEEYAQIEKIINIRVDGKWDYGWKVVKVDTSKFIECAIESKDINTEKEKVVTYRGKGDDFKYNAVYEPRDKDHQ